MAPGPFWRAMRVAATTLVILAAAGLAIERLIIPELAQPIRPDQIRQLAVLGTILLAAALAFAFTLALQALQRRAESRRHQDLEEQLQLSQQQVAETERTAAIGSWRWDLEKSLVYWSDEMYRIFGVERDTFEPTPDDALRRVPSEDREAVRRAINQARHGQPYELEHRVLRPDGDVRTVLDRANVAAGPAEAPTLIVGTTQDLTDLRRLENNLQLRRETYLSLLDAQSDLGQGALMTEGDQILYINPAMLTLLAQLTDPTDSLTELLTAIDPAGGSALRQELDLRRDRALPPAQGEAHLSRADGSSVEIEYVVDSISLADRVRTVALVRDVTERRWADAELRKSREQLRLFSVELARVREAESSRISREIHDELGQRLTGLKMDLAWVAAQLKKGDAKHLSLIMDKTKEMSRLVDDSVQEVRRIATELRPGVLDDLGFAAALEWQADEFQRRTGITCKVRAPANLAAGDDQSTALFRILQEALTNVSRHAKAKTVEVRLSEQDQSILLEIEDDGRGIQATNLAGPGSLGLLGMQERARLVGGETVIERGAAGGTVVRVRLPKLPAGAIQDPT